MERIKARTAPLAVRVKEDDEREGVIEAYASVFGTRYDVGFAQERVAKGAFLDSLDARGSLAIYHEHGWKRGDAPIGVAEAREDDTGLLVEAELFLDDPKAASVYRSVERGALNEWSIGFVPTEVAIVRDEDGLDVEEVRRADLLEASTTIRGANPDTSTVGVRASSGCPVCASEPAVVDERDDLDDDEPHEQLTIDDALRGLDLTDPAERWLAEQLSEG